MTTFDDRENAFENKYAHDEEMKFKAEMRRNMGQLAASVPHWQRVVELAPADADAWIEGATALTRLERYKDARDWLAAAREIHPTRPELRTIDETVEAVLAKTSHLAFW